MTLLRRFWWAIPIMAFAAAWLLERSAHADTRLTLANERAAWTKTLSDADLAKAAAERRHAMHLAQAATAFSDRLTARQPIILKSTNTVREYAQTDAGRAVCLGADRVRGIDALSADLADAAAPAGRGGDALPPVTAAASTGR